ncbi:MAG: hypothetical protein EZS28_055941, partial [Streblomastix strix]
MGDYGLASNVEGKSYIEAAGTKNYSASEAHENQMMTAESDIWAAGVVVIEYITGIHPFEGATQNETIANIKSGKSKPLPSYIQ